MLQTSKGPLFQVFAGTTLLLPLGQFSSHCFFIGRMLKYLNGQGPRILSGALFGVFIGTMSQSSRAPQGHCSMIYNDNVIAY